MYHSRRPGRVALVAAVGARDMVHQRTFANTLALLDQAIQARVETIAALQDEVSQFRAERAALMKGLSAPSAPEINGKAPAGTQAALPGVDEPDDAERISCPVAVDRVLAAADADGLPVAEIHRRIHSLGVPLKGEANETSVRSVLHRRASAMGWEKRKGPDGVCWAKAGGAS